MKKYTLILASITFISLLTACNNDSTQKNMDKPVSEISTPKVDSIITQSLTDKAGNKLDFAFNNTKDNVTINFMGDTSTLQSQKPASGIWYKNDRYELSGKGNDITLMKDGTIIFEHKDSKVEITAKNDKGDELNMTFNNSDGTLKAYLNGGEQIDLVEEKAASGIWYKNEHFELSGKGDKYELKKDGKTVFKN